RCGTRGTLPRGVRLRVTVTVTDASEGYKPLSGAAVYVWHCDRLGRYSMYSAGVADENYLRGIVKTDGGCGRDAWRGSPCRHTATRDPGRAPRRPRRAGRGGGVC